MRGNFFPQKPGIPSNPPKNFQFFLSSLVYSKVIFKSKPALTSSSRWQGPLELQAVCRVPCKALPDTFLVYLETSWEKETLVLPQKLIVQQASKVSLELFARTPSWIGQTLAQVPLGSSFHHATLHLWGSCVTIQRGVA